MCSFHENEEEYLEQNRQCSRWQRHGYNKVIKGLFLNSVKDSGHLLLTPTSMQKDDRHTIYSSMGTYACKYKQYNDETMP